MLLFNGKIHTQDKNRPFAEALLILDNKIIQVGSNYEVRAAAENINGIDHIDLNGKLVLPGFIDSHFHFYEWALNYNSIDLSKVFSFKGMEQVLKVKAESVKNGEWLLGYGFNESDWPENRMPDKNDLDKIAPDNPVCIWRCDLHIGVANSLGLKTAGINSNTPDPSEGKIVKIDYEKSGKKAKKLLWNSIFDLIEGNLKKSPQEIANV